MNHLEFINAVAERASTSPDQAEVLTRAMLETLADRLTGDETEDLTSELPKTLRGPLRRSRDKPPERFGLEEFVRRASERAGVDAATARDGVRAVLTTVREAVSHGEFHDVLSQLPEEFAEVIEPISRRSPSP